MVVRQLYFVRVQNNWTQSSRQECVHRPKWCHIWSSSILVFVRLFCSSQSKSLIYHQKCAAPIIRPTHTHRYERFIVRSRIKLFSISFSLSRIFQTILIRFGPIWILTFDETHVDANEELTKKKLFHFYYPYTSLRACATAYIERRHRHRQRRRRRRQR